MQPRNPRQAGQGDVRVEGQGVPDHLDPEQHLLEVAWDGGLFHRIGQLAAFDPEAHSAAGIVAGGEVHAGADQLGDVEAGVHRPDDLGMIVKHRMIRELPPTGLSSPR